MNEETVLKEQIGYDAPDLGQYFELIRFLEKTGVCVREASDTNGPVKLHTIEIYENGAQTPLGIIGITPIGMYHQISDSKVATVVDEYLYFLKKKS